VYYFDFNDFDIDSIVYYIRLYYSQILQGEKMAAIEELLREISEDGRDTLLLIRELSGFVAYYRRVLERLELDALTGLPGNNKCVDFKAGLEKRAQSVGVIIFDVNDLKYHNDKMGHQAGDMLLQKAAESFQAITANPNARVFRTGGDEFMAIITNCAASDIDAAIAAWQTKLAELNTEDDGIRCTIAHGTAFGSKPYKLTDVMALADERMYAEKRRMKEAGIKLGDVR